MLYSLQLWRMITWDIYCMESSHSELSKNPVIPARNCLLIFLFVLCTSLVPVRYHFSFVDEKPFFRSTCQFWMHFSKQTGENISNITIWFSVFVRSTCMTYWVKITLLRVKQNLKIQIDTYLSRERRKNIIPHPNF